jgi:hypothetical protein
VLADETRRAGRGLFKTNRLANVDYTFAGRGPALSIIVIILLVIVVIALVGFLARGRMSR